LKVDHVVGCHDPFHRRGEEVAEVKARGRLVSPVWDASDSEEIER
jgi:hypothetical protein